MGKTLIKNAKIWTANEAAPWAEAVVIDGNELAFVGKNDDAEAFAKALSDVEVMDAEGKMIMPAILDSHVHTTAIAKTMWCLLLDTFKYESIEQIMEDVAEHCRIHPKEEEPYIYAYSCVTELLDAAYDYADKHFMDKYVSDRPVLLCDMNYHRCLVNSKMLELMEVDENTPYNYETSMNYLRYGEGSDRGTPNEPTGIIEERVHEFNGDLEKMFKNLNWQPPGEENPEVQKPVLDLLNHDGICAVQDGFTETEKTLIGLKALEDAGQLHMYYHPQPLAKTLDDIDAAIQNAKDWQAKYGSNLITVDTVKLFLDGTNELATGAVIEPMNVDEADDKANPYGILNVPEDDLVEMFCRLNQNDLSAQLHIVGDRAFRVAVNAYNRAKASEENAGRKFNSRITLLHCELVHPDDRKRVAEENLYINVTTFFAAGSFGDTAKIYLGEDRFNSMFADQEMIESGAVVNFSSDMVDGEGLPLINPFIGIRTGMQRMLPEFEMTEPRPMESERFSLEQLLYGYTINNARGMGIEDKTGSLEVGKRANLLILPKNLFELTSDEIGEIMPEVYMFEGEIIETKDYREEA